MMVAYQPPGAYQGPPASWHERCMIHNRWEPWFQGQSYRACGECLHVYQSAEELLHEHRKIVEEFQSQPIEQADDIWICPLCTHDF